MQRVRPKPGRTAGSAVAASVSDPVAARSAGERIDLESLRSSRTRALLAGPYRSPFRGRGIEFDEVRAYQPGDDARFIDWRVSARRGRVYTKLFHEDLRLFPGRKMTALGDFVEVDELGIRLLRPAQR